MGEKWPVQPILTCLDTATQTIGAAHDASQAQASALTSQSIAQRSLEKIEILVRGNIVIRSANVYFENLCNTSF